MTDISRETIDSLLSVWEMGGLASDELHQVTDLIIALRAALDAAEADKARAVEAEREACAVTADGMWGEGPSGSYGNGGTQDGFNIATQQIAAAIRARRETK